MISPELKSSLPSTEDLPCSDDTPVDNEDQNLLPNLLLLVLTGIWSDDRLVTQNSKLKTQNSQTTVN